MPNRITPVIHTHTLPRPQSTQYSLPLQFCNISLAVQPSTLKCIASPIRTIACTSQVDCVVVVSNQQRPINAQICANLPIAIKRIKINVHFRVCPIIARFVQIGVPSPMTECLTRVYPPRNIRMTVSFISRLCSSVIPTHK